MKRAAAFSVAFLLSGIHAEGAPKQYPVTKVPSPVVEVKTIDERRSPKESIRHGTSDVGDVDLFWVRSMIWSGWEWLWFICDIFRCLMNPVSPVGQRFGRASLLWAVRWWTFWKIWKRSWRLGPKKMRTWTKRWNAGARCGQVELDGVRMCWSKVTRLHTSAYPAYPQSLRSITGDGADQDWAPWLETSLVQMQQSIMHKIWEFQKKASPTISDILRLALLWSLFEWKPKGSKCGSECPAVTPWNVSFYSFQEHGRHRVPTHHTQRFDRDQRGRFRAPLFRDQRPWRRPGDWARNRLEQIGTDWIGSRASRIKMQISRNQDESRWIKQQNTGSSH